MKKVGLFFGTFNPIHTGHLILACYMAEFTDLEEVWFVVSPRSPFKPKQTLLPDHHRFQLVSEAIRDYPKLKASKVEFTLPQPNYTIHTLLKLEEDNGKKYEFALLMGEDNLNGLPRWKNYEAILEHYKIYVYPRVSGAEVETRFRDHPAIQYCDAPVIEISSTFIRKNHKAGKDIRAMLPEAVWKYMDEMNFYR